MNVSPHTELTLDFRATTWLAQMVGGERVLIESLRKLQEQGGVQLLLSSSSISFAGRFELKAPRLLEFDDIHFLNAAYLILSRPNRDQDSWKSLKLKFADAWGRLSLMNLTLHPDEATGEVLQFPVFDFISSDLDLMCPTFKQFFFESPNVSAWLLAQIEE